MEHDFQGKVRWSGDEDHYIGTIDVNGRHGEVFTLSASIPRSSVVAKALHRWNVCAATAPGGVAVGEASADNPAFGRLVNFYAVDALKAALGAKIRRYGHRAIVPWFGRWTPAICDSAWLRIKAARAGDHLAQEEILGIAQAAKHDVRAREAHRMFQAIHVLVVRGLPKPSMLLVRQPSMVSPLARPMVPIATSRPMALPQPLENDEQLPVEDDDPELAEELDEVEAAGELPILEHYVVVGRRRGKPRRKRISSARAVQVLRRAAATRKAATAPGQPGATTPTAASQPAGAPTAEQYPDEGAPPSDDGPPPEGDGTSYPDEGAQVGSVPEQFVGTVETGEKSCITMNASG